jgi:hypothetical protein
MPRSVKRAIAVGQRVKMADQRAETGERRGALVNRIADLHCVVVYRLRADSGGTVTSLVSIVVSKGVFERWRTLLDRISAALIASAQRA